MISIYVFSSIKAQKFGFAGTKDKRSVSSQQVCVRKGDVEKFRSCQNLRSEFD